MDRSHSTITRVLTTAAALTSVLILTTGCQSGDMPEVGPTLSAAPVAVAPLPAVNPITLSLAMSGQTIALVVGQEAIISEMPTGMPTTGYIKSADTTVVSVTTQPVVTDGITVTEGKLKAEIEGLTTVQVYDKNPDVDPSASMLMEFPVAVSPASSNVVPEDSADTAPIVD